MAIQSGARGSGIQTLEGSGDIMAHGKDGRVGMAVLKMGLAAQMLLAAMRSGLDSRITMAQGNHAPLGPCGAMMIDAHALRDSATRKVAVITAIFLAQITAPATAVDVLHPVSASTACAQPRFPR